jgi:hypothetical protein
MKRRHEGMHEDDYVIEDSKQEPQSLDEDDYVIEESKEPEVPTQRERKPYKDCNRATKNGMRCLRFSKNTFKIGTECYDFCAEHVQEALVKLLQLLTGPLAFRKKGSQEGGTSRTVRDDQCRREPFGYVVRSKSSSVRKCKRYRKIPGYTQQVECSRTIACLPTNNQRGELCRENLQIFDRIQW